MAGARQHFLAQPRRRHGMEFNRTKALLGSSGFYQGHSTGPTGAASRPQDVYFFKIDSSKRRRRTKEARKEGERDHVQEDFAIIMKI